MTTEAPRKRGSGVCREVLSAPKVLFESNRKALLVGSSEKCLIESPILGYQRNKKVPCEGTQRNREIEKAVVTKRCPVLRRETG